MQDKELNERLEQYECAGRIVPIERLSDLRESIDEGRREGLIDAAVYDQYLKNFVFSPPETLPDAKSLIIVASKQPQILFTFHKDGKKKQFFVPPTYLHAGESDKRVADLLTDMLGGYRVVRANLPLKLLAAHSGLAVYGRNNLTYVPGMGSFHRLTAFYSDLPPHEKSEWKTLDTMKRCFECQACTYKCPTHALDQSRYRQYAEKCITFQNEKPSDVPFPEWILPEWHNCIVGCMICQKICPENLYHTGNVEDGPEFSEEETAFLLEGVPLEKMPAELVKKLRDSDLDSLLDVLPRNLGALLP